MKIRSILFIAIILFSGTLYAETIIMKNGDVINGHVVDQTRATITIVNEDGKKVQYKKDQIRRIRYGLSDEEKQKLAEEERKKKEEADRQKREEEQRQRADEERRRKEEEARRKRLDEEEKQKQAAEEEQKKADEARRKKEEEVRLKADEQKRKEEAAAREKEKKEALRREKSAEREKVLAGRNRLDIRLSGVGGNRSDFTENLLNQFNTITMLFKNGVVQNQKWQRTDVRGSSLHAEYTWRSLYAGLDITRLNGEPQFAGFEKSTDTGSTPPQDRLLYNVNRGKQVYEDRSFALGWYPIVRERWDLYVAPGLRRSIYDTPIGSVGIRSQSSATSSSDALDLSSDYRNSISPGGGFLRFGYNYRAERNWEISFAMDIFRMRSDWIFNMDQVEMGISGWSGMSQSIIHFRGKTTTTGSSLNLSGKYPLKGGFFLVGGVGYVQSKVAFDSLYLDKTMNFQNGVLQTGGGGPDPVMGSIIFNKMRSMFNGQDNIRTISLGVEKRFDFAR